MKLQNVPELVSKGPQYAGHRCEVQLHLKPFLDLKATEHATYERVRNMFY